MRPSDRSLIWMSLSDGWKSCRVWSWARRGIRDTIVLGKSVGLRLSPEDKWE